MHHDGRIDYKTEMLNHNIQDSVNIQSFVISDIHVCKMYQNSVCLSFELFVVGVDDNRDINENGLLVIFLYRVFCNYCDCIVIVNAFDHNNCVFDMHCI